MNNKKSIFLASLLAVAICSLHAQQLAAQSPRLVVNVTIDQLRSDYLEAFSQLYGEQGFKRLMREGRFYQQVEFPFDGVDRASATATLQTGTTPSLHGIIAENWLDAATLRPVNCADDAAFMGNYTSESSSPNRVLTSTLSDELRIATRNRGLAYSIAPFRDAALIAAGHAGNGAFWLNEENGKWCSTTFYKDFPYWLSQYNERQPVDTRIKGKIWEPLKPFQLYTHLPEWRTEAFRYKLDSDRHNRFRNLLTTPFINEEVSLLAEELLTRTPLGLDETPDLLSLTYYAGPYKHNAIQNVAMELQDTYARLDQELAKLIALLDKKVGLQHVLLCINSTGYAEPDAPDHGLYNVPGGEFRLNRCATLLNMYLMATYGEGHYVEGYYNRQIYLNHKLIEKKQLNLTEVQERAAEFLVQFSGVDRVYSANRLLLGRDWTPQTGRAANGFHRQHSGDLIIEILPGWTVVREDGNNSRVTRCAHVPAPLILLGAGITAEKILLPVEACRIAPTLAHAIHIRAPNGCNSSPLF